MPIQISNFSTFIAFRICELVSRTEIRSEMRSATMSGTELRARVRALISKTEKEGLKGDVPSLPSQSDPLIDSIKARLRLRSRAEEAPAPVRVLGAKKRQKSPDLSEFAPMAEFEAEPSEESIDLGFSRVSGAHAAALGTQATHRMCLQQTGRGQRRQLSKNTMDRLKQIEDQLFGKISSGVNNPKGF